MVSSGEYLWHGNAVSLVTRQPTCCTYYAAPARTTCDIMHFLEYRYTGPFDGTKRRAFVASAIARSQSDRLVPVQLPEGHSSLENIPLPDKL